MQQLFAFEEIGLETRDRRVYESLVKNPSSSLRTIATATGINRGSVYESVKTLVEHGLVSSVAIGKQHRYLASAPSVIIEILKERQHQAKYAEQAAEAYIASLVTPDVSAAADIPFVQFYQDNEGVAAILRDIIATSKALPKRSYRVISTKTVRQYMYQNFPNFTQRRIAEKIEVRVIAVGTGGVQDPGSERKWLASERGDAPNCYTIIYANKTAFITMDEHNVLSGTVIDNAGVAALQKELFDRLWQTL